MSLYLRIGILICLLTTPVMAQVQSPDWAWKRLQLTFVSNADGPWTTKDIQDILKRAKPILERCQIEVLPYQVRWDLPAELRMGYEFSPTANRYLQSAAEDLVEPPFVFLLSEGQQNGSAGLAPGRRYLYLSHQVLSTEYRSARDSSYSPLAHELGHLLGNLRHLSHGPNLMSGYTSLLNHELTDGQCEDMRASRYLLETIPTD